MYHENKAMEGLTHLVIFICILSVGYTAAAAVQYVLSPNVVAHSPRGLLLPMQPSIYQPILDRLDTQHGIRFHETVERSPDHMNPLRAEQRV
jgi:hypothetical protein